MSTSKTDLCARCGSPQLDHWWMSPSATQVCSGFRPRPTPTEPTMKQLAAAQAEALAWLEHEACDLRCVNASNGDDYSIEWQVIEHHMDEPAERVIGYGETPTQAIKNAQKALAAGGGHE